MFLKLFLLFVLLYIFFVQGRHVYLEIYRFFRQVIQKNSSDIHITRLHPPRKQNTLKKKENI